MGLNDNPKSYILRAGLNDLRDENATPRSIKAIHAHPYYDRSVSADYDIAILELELKDSIKLDGDSRSRAACLPSPDDTEFDEGSKLTVSGWGSTVQTPDVKLPMELRDATIPWA